jgi:exosome complex RNA-binding protein Rrp42 (RNase PH superfamily)
LLVLLLNNIWNFIEKNTVWRNRSVKKNKITSNSKILILNKLIVIGFVWIVIIWIFPFEKNVIDARFKPEKIMKNACSITINATSSTITTLINNLKDLHKPRLKKLFECKLQKKRTKMHKIQFILKKYSVDKNCQAYLR